MAIPDVLSMVEDLQQVTIDAISAIETKHYLKLIEILPDLIGLFKDLKSAIPEIKSMDATDAKDLMKALVDAVEAILASIAHPVGVE